MHQPLKNKLIAFLKLAAIVIGAMLALLQIWDWFTKPSDDLRAKATFAEVHIPPTLERQLDAVGTRFASEEFLAEIVRGTYIDTDTDNEKQLAEREADRILRTLRREVPTSLPYEVAVLSGCYVMEISNAGKSTLKDVQVVVPNARLFKLVRENDLESVSATKGIMSIGNLQPLEVVEVFAWTTSSYSRYSSDVIRLTHATGIGSVSVYAAASPFAQWIDDWAVIDFIMCTGLALTFGSIMFPVLQALFSSRPMDPASSPTLPIEKAE